MTERVKEEAGDHGPPSTTERVKEEAGYHGPFTRQEVERSKGHGGKCWRPSDGHTGSAEVMSEAEASIRLEQRRLDQARSEAPVMDHWGPARGSAKVEPDLESLLQGHGGGGDGQVGITDPGAGHSQDEVVDESDESDIADLNRPSKCAKHIVLQFQKPNKGPAKH